MTRRNNVDAFTYAVAVLLGIAILVFFSWAAHSEPRREHTPLPPIGTHMMAREGILCDTKEQLESIVGPSNLNARIARLQELATTKDANNEPTCNVQQIVGPTIAGIEYMLTRDGMDFYALKLHGEHENDVGYLLWGAKSEDIDL